MADHKPASVVHRIEEVRSLDSAPERPWVVALSSLIVALVAVATTVGVLTSAGDGPRPFGTVRGETTEIYGRGIYAYDSVMVGSGSVGVDLVTLGIGLPLLVVFTVLYRRGSIRGGMLLAGILGYLVYVYAGRTLGTAYNDLFLLNVAIFSASVFNLGAVLGTLRSGDLFETIDLPDKPIAVVMLTVAALTAVLWLETPVTALVRSSAPATLDHYTTLFTHGLDLAVVVPLLVLAGVQVLRGRHRVYVTVFPVLFLIAMLAPALTAMTLSQVSSGVDIAPEQIIAYVASFVVLGIAALWVIWRLIKGLPSIEVDLPK